LTSEVQEKVTQEFSIDALEAKRQVRVQAQKERRRVHEAHMQAMEERRAPLRAERVRKATERAERERIAAAAGAIAMQDLVLVRESGFKKTA